MTELDILLPEDEALVTSTLYRAGAWMSRADDEPGGHDDLKEREALERIIALVARLHEKSPLVRDIAKGTLAGKESWPQWRRRTGEFLADCGRAVRLLDGFASRAEVDEYRATVYQVAEFVARAHGEFGKDPKDVSENMLAGFFEAIAKKFASADNAGDVENISDAERAALKQLKQALARPPA